MNLISDMPVLILGLALSIFIPIIAIEACLRHKVEEMIPAVVLISVVSTSILLILLAYCVG